MRNPLMLAALLAIAGCSSQQKMTGTQKLPAAEGKVEFSETANENTEIDLRVKHLSQPEKLTPPAGAYVVWAKAANDSKPQNLGEHQVDEELTGKLKTVTPLHDFLLQVTAEPNGQVEMPTGEPLLTASYSR